MDVSKYLHGKRFKGCDLPDEGLVLTVSAVGEEKFNGDTKLALSFEGWNTKLTLNKTQSKKMIELFGPNQELWIDKTLKISPLDYTDVVSIGIEAAYD